MDQFTFMFNSNPLNPSSLKNIRAKSPKRLHNKTVGDILEMTDWVSNGRELSEKLMTGVHDNKCNELDGSPIITNQQSYYPHFQPLRKKNNSQCIGKSGSGEKLSSMNKNLYCLLWTASTFFSTWVPYV